MVHHEMEPRAWVFLTFFHVRAHPRKEGWWYASPCKGAKASWLEIMISFMASLMTWPFFSTWGEVKTSWLLELPTQ